MSDPKPKKWFKREKTSYNHKSEFTVEAQLNIFLIPMGMKAIRNNDHYGPDIEIFKFNSLTMETGIKIRNVEVEEKDKNKYKFENYPESDWPYWSFLWRKVHKLDEFKDDDVYLLCNSYPHDKIYWAKFGDIRNKCKLYKRIPEDKEEWYYRILVRNSKQISLFDEFISRGYKSLAIYLNSLERNE